MHYNFPGKRLSNKNAWFWEDSLNSDGLWENQINICATFVDDDNFETEVDPCQFPQDNILNGMYDLIPWTNIILIRSFYYTIFAYTIIWKLLLESVVYHH
jgi:hypothetical protein